MRLHRISISMLVSAHIHTKTPTIHIGTHILVKNKMSFKQELHMYFPTESKETMASTQASKRFYKRVLATKSKAITAVQMKPRIDRKTLSP